MPAGMYIGSLPDSEALAIAGPSGCVYYKAASFTLTPSDTEGMDLIYEFLNWAWERHHNPLSWYIRPLFVLPFCYFAYKKSVWGMVLTIVGVLSSMFWFPAPASGDARAAEFLAMERKYITGNWTFAKTAMTALVPVWFFVLAWSFWKRSWLAGFLVINVGALLKVIWSFYFGGSSAWSIIPAVAGGAIVINGVMLFVYWRVRGQSEISDGRHESAAGS